MENVFSQIDMICLQGDFCSPINSFKRYLLTMLNLKLTKICITKKSLAICQSDSGFDPLPQILLNLPSAPRLTENLYGMLRYLYFS